MESPSSNKKRKSAVALPSQKRCIIKKTKIPGDLAGTCALSRSPSKIPFVSSPTSLNQPARIPSAKNAKAGPSASLNDTSHNRDLTRVSSKVSCPTFKKKALSVKKTCLPESDGTPPLSIILPTPSPSPKQKKPKSSPTKRLAGNCTPSKRKWLDPSPIELSSSDDDSRPQPPRKRIKHVYKKPFGSEVIDLCSESEDAFASPRHSCTRDERSVVVLSTDEDVDLDFPASSHLAFRKIDTRKSPALSSLKDISPPIEIESVFQASPPPLTHNTLVSKPKALVFEEDGVTDRNNICAKKVGPPRGSLQVLYNEALARCVRDPRRKKDNSGQPSPFSSLKCVPPARIIRYATQTQFPSLHTPLFFSRVILRLRARQKQPKILDTKPISGAKPFPGVKPFPGAKPFSDAKFFSDARASFLNPKAFPDATTFSAVSNDTDLNPMEVSNFNEDQDTPYPDSVMEISTVDSEALEIATVLIPPIDVQDDISSDTQVASISLSSTIPFSVISNDADLNSMKVSKLNEDQDTVTYPDSIMEISAVDSEALEIATQTILIPPIDFQASDTQVASISLSSTNTLSSRASSLSTRSLHSLDSSASIESVNCHLLTQDESPSPHTPLVKVQKQESLICSNLFPSTIGVSFDIDMSELNLQMIMYNLFDEDNDDDISISGMELTYPEA